MPTLRSAHSFLKSYIRLSTLLSKPNYQWYIPSLLLPLEPLSILLTHLNSQPTRSPNLNPTPNQPPNPGANSTPKSNPVTPESTTRDLINTTFALSVLRDVGNTTIVTRALGYDSREFICKPDTGNVPSQLQVVCNSRRSCWERLGWEIPGDEQVCSVIDTNGSDGVSDKTAHNPGEKNGYELTLGANAACLEHSWDDAGRVFINTFIHLPNHRQFLMTLCNRL